MFFWPTVKMARHLAANSRSPTSRAMASAASNAARYSPLSQATGPNQSVSSVLCWFLSIILLIYFLRAEMIEWLVSATVALAAICLTWLLAAGILTSAGKSAPLYAAMLPPGAWSGFMPLQEPPQPVNV